MLWREGVNEKLDWSVLRFWRHPRRGGVGAALAESFQLRNDAIYDPTQMILASHIIVSCYGFWLPNEERGSWSDFVRSDELYYNFGAATKVQTHRSVANRPYDKQRRWDARHSLAYPPVEFTGIQAREVGLAFAEKARKSEYAIHACAIMRNHLHLVVGRHQYDFLQIANLLKGAATTRLTQKGLHPLQGFQTPSGRTPSPWAHRCWVVYLDTDSDVCRAIKYVEDNPSRRGRSGRIGLVWFRMNRADPRRARPFGDGAKRSRMRVS